VTDAHVAYHAQNGVARLTLTQLARLNAMSFDMWASLPALVARAEADADVRVIELRGAGERAFCAGADISQFGERRTGDDAVQAYEDAVAAAMAAVSEAEKPSVARVRGVAFGGGLALALCCDLRFGETTARLRIPAARLGLGYAFANVEALVARLGLGPASDLLLSARAIDGCEGERLGVFNKAWAPEAFEREADAAVAAIASNAPLTLKALKFALRQCAKPFDARDRAAADALVAACFRSDDYQEGQAAFREKREPRFRGA
jgi:enoyl-CoA hydratase/carnithine racemase